MMKTRVTYGFVVQDATSRAKVGEFDVSGSVNQHVFGLHVSDVKTKQSQKTTFLTVIQ